MADIINENVTEEFNADLYLEKLEAELFSDDLDNENKSNYNDFIIDCLEFAMNFDDDELEVITEGFNNDLKKQYKEDIKEIKRLMKSVKKDIKNGNNYEGAIHALDSMNEKIDKMIADIKAIKGDKAATVVGSLYRGYIGMVKMFVAGILTFPIGGIGSIVAAAEHSITDAFGMYSNITDKIKSGQELSIDDFNSYKNFIISGYKGYKDKIAKIRKEVEAKMEFYKTSKEAVAKEKVNDLFEQERLKLYEACSAGEITEDQREMLLNRFKLINKVEESAIANDINEDYSNKDAFNAIKKDIYERCSKGEFDIDVREDLIKEAYQRFMENEDTNVDKIVDSFKKKNNLEQDSKKLISDVNNSVTT